ncbi:MAG: zinc ABC transporter substrate-binding protein [Clostridiaceae bacterium]|nr:zinc ABC transporter substrate-binding protein [Clostridiaceae bacterium]
MRFFRFAGICAFCNFGMGVVSITYFIRRKIPVLIAVALTLFLSAVGLPQKGYAEDNELTAIATTTLLWDLTENIAGERIQVEFLMGPGIDPHLYQASAEDVYLLQNADLIICNGFCLEERMGEMLDSFEREGKAVICIEDGIDKNMFLECQPGSGQYDPHVWFDVSLWKQAAVYIANRLILLDPHGGETYSKNLNKYLEELNELEEYIKSRVSGIGEEHRILVTDYDAFRYFCRAYGFEVKSLLGISTNDEVRTADVSTLAGFIAENRIKAIFAESTLPEKNIEDLEASVREKGFETSIGGKLYSDSLGDEASGYGGYIEAFKANIDAIVDALK